LILKYNLRFSFNDAFEINPNYCISRNRGYYLSLNFLFKIS
jgi:hypothetical protein